MYEGSFFSLGVLNPSRAEGRRTARVKLWVYGFAVPAHRSMATRRVFTIGHQNQKKTGKIKAQLLVTTNVTSQNEKSNHGEHTSIVRLSARRFVDSSFSDVE
jgi:hypothetical protein